MALYTLSLRLGVHEEKRRKNTRDPSERAGDKSTCLHQSNSSNTFTLPMSLYICTEREKRRVRIKRNPLTKTVIVYPGLKLANQSLIIELSVQGAAPPGGGTWRPLAARECVRRTALGERGRTKRAQRSLRLASKCIPSMGPIRLRSLSDHEAGRLIGSATRRPLSAGLAARSPSRAKFARNLFLPSEFQISKLQASLVARAAPQS